ncbi:MAG: DUF349 domain-containing protein [Ornithinimicrobium sp.]|uniref:DUF349 domain-containing protein n=1 Tax=Ornithinimicrobium sp. TaxID=1977084 RepID=UPI003D9B5880
MPTQVGGSSEAMAFGRVAEDGTVYVRTEDGERAVGSYPGTSPAEALSYFARKYDELAAAADVLSQRLSQTDLSAHEARESLAHLRQQIGDAHVVGDLAALHRQVDQIAQSISERAAAESASRAQAKAKASAQREQLVVEAEAIAATEPTKMQWKAASSRMRDLFDTWKTMQRSGPRLDKDVEAALWQRFSAARTAFDKVRKSWFAHLDEEQEQARRVKERLVAQAEELTKSKDWGATAGEFKSLMQQWRKAGRAQRSQDDALWTRFKTAQDRFFEAKDEIVAQENAEFEANLVVKQALLEEAEGLVPVTDLQGAKARLRSIQDRWDVAGKVPKSQMHTVETRMRAVEKAVRDLEDRRWKQSNPEVSARAQSMVDQLERAVQGLHQDLAAALAGGDPAAIAEAEQALEARQAWLDSARAGLAEFGG